MNLNEAKDILKKNGYKVLSEATGYDDVRNYLNGTSLEGTEIKFIATFISEDSGEPDEEIINANTWTVALCKAMRMCREMSMELIDLKIDDGIVDTLINELSGGDYSDDD